MSIVGETGYHSRKPPGERSRKVNGGGEQALPDNVVHLHTYYARLECICGLVSV